MEKDQTQEMSAAKPLKSKPRGHDATKQRQKRMHENRELVFLGSAYFNLFCFHLYAYFNAYISNPA